MFIITLFINCISFLGDWLLFAFPFYQGLMELYDYEWFLKEFNQSSKAQPKISPLYWIIPIVKIYLEKKRAVKILGSIIKKDSDLRIVMSFTDKATAWYFVSLGGWLKMVSSLYEFIGELHEDSILLLVGGTIVLTFLGIFSGYYRLNPKRQRVLISKIKKD
ncbi:hypothetical protein [uncultured Lactobacillus sp.]|uniref:hypothetical protein n=1 Tax=uncultured Lactobacillus sp. TaxID=153152 RepID=UPI0025DBDDF9|nr:hypothetical protein [uncultured Lactobacillus sp.]